MRTFFDVGGRTQEGGDGPTLTGRPRRSAQWRRGTRVRYRTTCYFHARIRTHRMSPAGALATSQLRATKRFSPDISRCSPPKTPFCTLHNQHIAAQILGMRFFANVRLSTPLEAVGGNNRRRRAFNHVDPGGEGSTLTNAHRIRTSVASFF